METYLDYISDIETREREEKELTELYKGKTKFSFGEIMVQYNKDLKICSHCNGSGTTKILLGDIKC